MSEINQDLPSINTIAHTLDSTKENIKINTNSKENIDNKIPNLNIISNIKKAIDNPSNLKDDEKEMKQMNYSQRENELRNNRQNILDIKRRNLESCLATNNVIVNERIKSLRNIKNMKLNKSGYSDSIFKCGINMRYNNEIFFNKIISGSNIPLKLANMYIVEGEGDCFYRCLSIFLYGKETYYHTLRKLVMTFCKNNISELTDFKKEVEIRNGVFMNTKQYIDNMEKNIYWSNDIEVTISSYLFCMNISIYLFSNDRANFEYVYSYIFDENNINNPLMILVN